jgi:hypothetical protein
MFSIRKQKVFNTVEDLYQDLFNKDNDYFNHSIDKYLVSYSINDNGLIEVESNIGRKRLVVNDEENIKRLNKLIVKSKIDIARKIDEYEKESSFRFVLIIITSIIIMLSFASVFFTLFIGNIELCLVSLLLFAFISSLNIINGINYYLLIREINSLKKSTHYKENNDVIIDEVKEDNKENDSTNNTDSNELSVTSLLLK